MKENFEKVKDYLHSSGYLITHEDEAEELVVIQDEENGITGMVIDCEEPILIIEQVIMGTPVNNKESFYETLLKINRNLVHGAFVLDESGSKVIYRDTLQLESLDHNELDASINSLTLALAENANQLLNYK
ncbi:MAG: YbjN domain-containing protein [Nitrospinae bacterium]|nr:YbjN domain-containing protein [Nitrospinota bacterium]